MQTVASESTCSSSSQLRIMPTASGHAMLLSAEEFPIYHLHITRFVTTLLPQTQAESDLVQRIADNEWRVDRIARLEMGIYARGQIEFSDLYPDQDASLRSLLIETHTHSAYERHLSNLATQEARLRRYVEKDTAELRDLQSQRITRETEKKPLAASAAASSVRAPRASAVATKNHDGFEFTDKPSAESPRPEYHDAETLLPPKQPLGGHPGPEVRSRRESSTK